MLRTYARLIGRLQGTAGAVAGPVYRPRLPLLWRIPDAMAHLKRLLPERLGAEAEAGSMSLWSFLPGPEALATPGQAHATAAPERALLRRSAVASTFVAGLELARQGQLALTQETLFGDVQASAGSAVATMEQGDDGAGARRT